MKKSTVPNTQCDSNSTGDSILDDIFPFSMLFFTTNMYYSCLCYMRDAAWLSKSSTQVAMPRFMFIKNRKKTT